MRSFFCISILMLSILFAESKYDTNWPNWRGPNNDGVGKGNPPIEWSETKNIKWKTPIPGKGLSTPVIWENQIFITTAIELDKKATEEAVKQLKEKSPGFQKLIGMYDMTEHFLQFVVYSIDRYSGKINWQKVVREQYPHEGVNKDGSWAAGSCVTDGTHVIASFGSYGIYCFDMKGNLVWEKDLGDMQVAMTMGEGTTPTLYGDNLIITWDHEGQSKLYNINKSTGDIIWEVARDEITSWSTPLVVECEEGKQIVVPGDIKTRAYDLTDGKLIWELGGLGDGVVASPVCDGQRVFVMTGWGRSKIVQAIDLNTAKGDLENSASVTWIYDKNTSYIPSPIYKDGKLYYLKGYRSQLSCVDSKTGKIYYEAEKPDGMKAIYASPIVTNGYIYLVDRNGTCTVLKEGETFEVVKQNILNDNIDASPAVVGNQLFLRSWNFLYCIQE